MEPPPTVASKEVDGSAQPDSSSSGWFKFANLGEIPAVIDDSKRQPVNGRDVTVWNKKGKYFALDSVCYHAGGPLANGDLTDIENLPCVVCPWHGFTFNMETGEALYYNMDDKLCSKGIKQRTHRVDIRSDGIYVSVVSDAARAALPALESDNYAYQELYKRQKKSIYG